MTSGHIPSKKKLNAYKCEVKVLTVRFYQFRNGTSNLQQRLRRMQISVHYDRLQWNNARHQSGPMYFKAMLLLEITEGKYTCSNFL